MGDSRKLQGEIDQILKKVQEGVDVYDSILNKALIDARKQIEREIERFNICEKEAKTETFPTEGLDQQPKMDPKEKAKSEMRDWLNNVVSELENQIDSFEAEIEELSVKKGKTRPPRLTHLEASITRHQAHIMKLELILSLLDNDELSPEQVNNVKDFVDDYVERNQLYNSQDDFDEFSDVDELYSFLPLDKVESPEALVTVGPPGLAKGQFHARTEIAPEQREKFQQHFEQVQLQGQTNPLGMPSLAGGKQYSAQQENLLLLKGQFHARSEIAPDKREKFVQRFQQVQWHGQTNLLGMPFLAGGKKYPAKQENLLQQFRARTEIAPDQREKFLQRFQQVQLQGQTNLLGMPTLAGGKQYSVQQENLDLRKFNTQSSSISPQLGLGAGVQASGANSVTFASPQPHQPNAVHQPTNQ